jgi:sec-independent protein translocase protein TatB
MFDFSIAELGVIGAVALVVIGPEQLPRVARTVGHLTGRLRRYVSDVKADISREMEMADFKRMQEEVESSLQHAKTAVQEEVSSIEQVAQHTLEPAVVSAFEPLAAEPSIAPPELIEPLAAVPAEPAPVLASESVALPAEQDVVAAPVVDDSQPDLFAAPAAPEHKH